VVKELEVTRRFFRKTKKEFLAEEEAVTGP
jgi:hypothetical protein